MYTFRTFILVFLACCGLNAWADPVGTSFTYQGELKQSGVAAEGSFDFRFDLFDAAEDGLEVGTTVDLIAADLPQFILKVTLVVGKQLFQLEDFQVLEAVGKGYGKGMVQRGKKPDMGSGVPVEPF